MFSLQDIISIFILFYIEYQKHFFPLLYKIMSLLPFNLLIPELKVIDTQTTPHYLQHFYISIVQILFIWSSIEIKPYIII